MVSCFKAILCRFSVCGKKVAATMPVVMNQEMEQIEMMGQQGHRGRDMMDPMDRMSNPWDNNFDVPRYGTGRGGRGGMMDGGRRPSGIRNPMRDHPRMALDRMDMDYMEYTDDLQDMALAMDNKYRGGSPNQMFERRGGAQRGGGIRGGNVGGGMRGGGLSGGMRGGMGGGLRGGNRAAPARGRTSFPPPAARGRGKAANPLFDNLYEPQFKSSTGPGGGAADIRNSLFEKARDKLNSKEPGVAKGGQMMGPPKKTWSN